MPRASLKLIIRRRVNGAKHRECGRAAVGGGRRRVGGGSAEWESAQVYWPVCAGGAGGSGGSGGGDSVVLEGALAQAAADGASSAARAEGGGDGPGGGAQSATSRSSATHHHQSTAASARAARPTRPGALSRPKYAHRWLVHRRARSLTRVFVRRRDWRGDAGARAATRRLRRRSREPTTAPEHYFGSDAPRRRRRRPRAARCQFYAKLRAGGDAICTTPRPPASAPPVRCSITFCSDFPFSLRGFFCEEVVRARTRTLPPLLDTCATRLYSK